MLTPIRCVSILPYIYSTSGDSLSRRNRRRSRQSGLERAVVNGYPSALAEKEIVMRNSSIEWTESTWNPVTGCTKITPDASLLRRTDGQRLRAMGQTRYRNGFRVTLQSDVVGLPLHWNRPRTIFVNSMSDLFHTAVPAEFIADCFSVMQRASRHTFQVLTKRPERGQSWRRSFPGPTTFGWARRWRARPILSESVTCSGFRRLFGSSRSNRSSALSRDCRSAASVG